MTATTATSKDEIRKHYKSRGADHVHIKIVNDEHMAAMNGRIKKMIDGRRFNGNDIKYRDVIQTWGDRRYYKYSNMFYLRHLAYAMSIKHQHQTSYDAYVSQREDAFYYESTGIDFTNMGYDYTIGNTYNGRQLSISSSSHNNADYQDLEDAKAYVFVEEHCEWGSYSDKIHIGNDFGMFALWGKTWQDFERLMLRWSGFGFIRSTGKRVQGWKKNLSVQDPFQTEAFLHDLLQNGHVEKIDVNRVDMRYSGNQRCVLTVYHTCLPLGGKKALAKLKVPLCDKKEKSFHPKKEKK